MITCWIICCCCWWWTTRNNLWKKIKNLKKKNQTERTEGDWGLCAEADSEASKAAIANCDGDWERERGGRCEVVVGVLRPEK